MCAKLTETPKRQNLSDATGLMSVFKNKLIADYDPENPASFIIMSQATLVIPAITSSLISVTLNFPNVWMSMGITVVLILFARVHNTAFKLLKLELPKSDNKMESVKNVVALIFIPMTLMIQLYFAFRLIGVFLNQLPV